MISNTDYSFHLLSNVSLQRAMQQQWEWNSQRTEENTTQPCVTSAFKYSIIFLYCIPPVSSNLRADPTKFHKAVIRKPCTSQQHMASYLPHHLGLSLHCLTFVSLPTLQHLVSPNPTSLFSWANKYSPLQYLKYKIYHPRLKLSV